MLKRNKDGVMGGIHHIAIAKRITLLYSGIFTLSLLVISFFMTLNISSLQQAEMGRQLQDTVSCIQDYLKSGEPLNDEMLTELLKDKYVEANVFSFSQKKMYHNYTGETPPFILSPEREQEREMPRRELGDFPLPKGASMADYQIHLSKENKNGDIVYILENDAEQQFMLITNHFQTEEGLYQIQVFKVIGDGGYMARDFLMKMLAMDLLGIFCAIWIGRWISRRMLRPVKAIRTAAERISIEDLSQRIPTEGPDDEMKELTITFNSMIHRLDTAFQRQNQFISDASHELRTPIAVIQGYANLINRWGKSDPDILQEAIDSILTETEHMSALIRQLLFLAKGDQSRLPMQKDWISLNEIAAEFAREMSLLEEKREITFSAQEEVQIFGDYDLLKQLLWIHGENALKYSDGPIRICVWKDGNNGYISIEDHGAGIAEEDIPKIFDRFYRVDKSRNKEISGTGLGLAIAHWIVNSHGGEILVESRLGEGTVFTDCFPLLDGQGKETKEPKGK